METTLVHVYRTFRQGGSWRLFRIRTSARTQPGSEIIRVLCHVINFFMLGMSWGRKVVRTAQEGEGGAL